MTEKDDLLEATNLVDSWNAAGWGEYLLFEVIAGKRERLFPVWTGITLSKDELATLKRLRDQHKTWFIYITGEWRALPIGKWRELAAETSADEQRDALGRKKR